MSGNPPGRVSEDAIRALIEAAQDAAQPMATRLAARNRVISLHMWLVHRHVKATNRPELCEDLTQACIAGTTSGQPHGLIRAIEKFDLGAGLKFSTYADAWIRRAINVELVAHTRGVSITVDMAAGRAKIRRAAAKLERSLGRAPTAEEVHATLRARKGKCLGIREVRAALSDMPRAVGDVPDDGPEFSDGLSEAALVRALDDKRMHERLMAALAALPEQERIAVRAATGLGAHDGEACTMRDVGALLGVPSWRARRVYLRGLAKLRAALTDGSA